MASQDLVVPRESQPRADWRKLFAPPVKNGINKSSRVWDLVVQIYSASTPILIIDLRDFFGKDKSLNK